MPQAPVKPLYVLHGQDDFLRRQYCRRSIERIIGQAETQLAVARFDVSAELAEVLDELRTAPLLAPHRAVVVAEADKFVSAHAQALTRYLAAPSASGSLVLMVNSWKAASQKKEDKQAFSALDKLARTVGDFLDCSTPPESQLPPWIRKATQRRGMKIAPDAVGLLAAWAGTDLARLDNEIEKLSLYAGPRGQIVLQDVAAVVAATTTPTPYALTDAIAAGQLGKALKELAAMMTTRGEEFRILGLIAWQLRRNLGTRPRGRQDATGRGDRAHRNFRKLLAADLAIKTSADPLMTMQMLLAKLCL